MVIFTAAMVATATAANPIKIFFFIVFDIIKIENMKFCFAPKQECSSLVLRADGALA
jgi:hypothetical protein